jgi:hypothetical protein
MKLRTALSTIQEESPDKLEDARARQMVLFNFNHKVALNPSPPPFIHAQTWQKPTTAPSTQRPGRNKPLPENMFTSKKQNLQGSSAALKIAGSGAILLLGTAASARALRTQPPPQPPTSLQIPGMAYAAVPLATGLGTAYLHRIMHKATGKPKKTKKAD